jgi:hypothetical protein
MHADRSVTLLSALTTTPSRRSTLRALSGLGLAGLFGRAEAKKRKKKSCPPCKHRKKGKCKPKPDGSPCGPGQVCQGLTCACDATSCSGDAVCLGGACTVPA